MLVNFPSEHLSWSDRFIPSAHMKGGVCVRLRDWPQVRRTRVWISDPPRILEQHFLAAQRTRPCANQDAVFWLQPIWTLIKWRLFPHNPASSVCVLTQLLSHFYMRRVPSEWFFFHLLNSFILYGFLNPLSYWFVIKMTVIIFPQFTSPKTESQGAH